MNRWRIACTGLMALSLSGFAASGQAWAAPDTWHGGGEDVIVLEPVFRDDVMEYEDDVRGVLPSGVGHVTLFGYDLRGRTGPYQYEATTESGAQWCTGSERFADARLDVPHNVNITHLRIWGFDGSADHDVAGILFRSCLPDMEAGTQTNTNLGTAASTGTPGAFTEAITISTEPTNTNLCTYYVRARFGVDCAGVGQTTFRKARVQYSTLP
jgi:hypothetical protein